MTPTFVTCYLSVAALQVRLLALVWPTAVWSQSQARALCPGGALALRGQRDGAVAAAEGPGPRQLVHPLPHGSGGLELYFINRSPKSTTLLKTAVL